MTPDTAARPQLDHAFILCSVGAPEAAALTRLGLKEGSGNTHPGQETACRRFFFRNAYLELLWVDDPEVAQSEAVRRTRLWDRWLTRRDGTCPFGVVLRPAPEAAGADPPFATWSYAPGYLPAGLSIDIALATPLSEPELFYPQVSARAREREEELRDSFWSSVAFSLSAVPPCLSSRPGTSSAGWTSFGIRRSPLVSWSP